MMTTICHVLAAVFVILYSIDVTTACSCLFQSPEEQYCGSDLVLSLEVTDPGVMEGHNLVYPMDVIKVNLNEDKPSPSDRPTHLVTLGDPLHSCSQVLNPGFYILGGKIVPDDSTRFRTSFCSYQRVFVNKKDLRKFKLPKCSKITTEDPTGPLVPTN